MCSICQIASAGTASIAAFGQPSSPEEGWPKWCNRQVRESIFVLVACTEAYLRRFDGDEAPGTGRGGTWEGHIITQELYNSQGRNKKFVPIVFSQGDGEFVPIILQGATVYQLFEQYDRLYDRLSGHPPHAMPELGKRSLPTLERRQEFQPVWLVQYQRNPFFTGREQILADLRETLLSGKRAALSGLGGTGKTQTAIEYAHRNREFYNAVFWIKAETRDTLLADFASLAIPLKLPAANAKEQSASVYEVKQWLEIRSGWLLILDNADELGLVKEFVPRNTNGHVLLTTRARALAGLAEPLPVRPMPPDEAALFLLHRARVAEDESQRSIALQISKELGYLPLALDQAGAFIEETPSSFAEYLSLLRAEKEKLLAERGSLGDHPSVTTTFSLAFTKVAEQSSAAADLIRLCAFLAPDAIPEEMFADHGSFDFTKMLREATRFSLIDRDPGSKTLDIHRLVQAVVRAGMSKSEQRGWAERAVRAVNDAFPYIEFENWALCQRLLPHAQVCASLIEVWDFEFQEAARLPHQAAYYLKQRAFFKEAEPLYQRSLAIYEKILGPDHPNVATGLNNLAEIYRDQTKYAEAEPLYRRSLAIYEKELGPDDPQVAGTLNNLAHLFQQQGKHVEAMPLYQRALAIREEELGPDHPDVAQSLNNLAELYREQGKYAEAEPLYRRSLAIFEKALRPDHPDLASSLNNLACYYYGRGKHAEALPLYQRALAIRENALGPDHPLTLATRSNLELCLRALDSPKAPHPS